MNSLCFFLFFIICVFQFKWSRFWLRGPSYCNKVTIHIFIFQLFINKQRFTLTLMYDKWSSVVIDKTYLNIKPVVWFKPKLHSYKIAIKKKQNKLEPDAGIFLNIDFSTFNRFLLGAEQRVLIGCFHLLSPSDLLLSATHPPLHPT